MQLSLFKGKLLEEQRTINVANPIPLEGFYLRFTLRHLHEWRTAHKSCVLPAVCTAVLEETIYHELKLNVWLCVWTGYVNPRKCLIEVVHTYVCGQTAELEVKWSQYFSWKLNISLPNTRRHISHKRKLHTLKHIYCWKLLNWIHHSAMDTWTDCNVVSTG
jgi:hypothetical protein